MPHLEFREARPEDAAALLEYIRAVASETENLLLGPEGLGLPVKAEQAFLENSLHSQKSIYLLAMDADVIAGQANFSCNEQRARIAHWGTVGITVRSSYWRQGIGSALMQRLIAFARDTAQAEMMQLEVRSDNAAAIALYEKFGFVKTGTFPRMIKIADRYYDCDTMVLCLSPSPAQL